jgi:hypothetical protein
MKGDAMRIRRWFGVAVLGLAALAVTGGAARADLIVVPGAFTSAEANSNDDFPLGSGANGGQIPGRVQQVYGTALLGGLSPGERITGLTFRLDGSVASPLPAQTVPDYQIILSRSANAPGALSTTFAANRGPDATTVFSGPLTIHAGDFPAGGSPNPFGVIISFSTPYTYEGGPLLVEIATDAFPAGGRFIDAVFPAANAEAVFGPGFSGTTANESFAEAFVIEFQIAPAPVPEPSTFALLALGGGALAGWRRLRKRTATV